MGRSLISPGDIFEDDTGMTVQILKIDSDRILFGIIAGTYDPVKSSMEMGKFIARFRRIGHGPIPKQLRMDGDAVA